MKYIIGLVIMLTISCSQNDTYKQSSEIEEYQGGFEKLVKEINSEINVNTFEKCTNVLFIPLDGCETCVKKSLDYAVKKSKMANTFVIVSINEKKHLSAFKKIYSIDDRLFKEKNVYVDLKHAALKSGVYSSFPILFEKDKIGLLTKRVSLNMTNINGFL